MRSGRSVTVHIDDSELETLEIDLREAPARMQLGSRKTMKRAAEIVDKGMVKDARGHRYLPRFPRNISHDSGNFDAEIGFDRSRGLQGALVWIILNGSINNAPVWDYAKVLVRTTPEILELYGATAEDATLGTKEA
jgi:hypothetical protein